MANRILARFTSHATNDPRWPAFQALTADAFSMLAGGTVPFTTVDDEVCIIAVEQPLDNTPIMYDAMTDQFRPVTQADYDQLVAHIVRQRRPAD